MTPPETTAHMAENPLLVERHGRVVTLTLDRPHRRNAMSTEMLNQLAYTLRELMGPGGDAPGALVLTGAGGTFSSGADTREPDWRDLSRRAVRRAHFRTVFAALHEAPFPVVAAVEGYALGGG
ncbi:enoyl-CoA hydratase/isomerase family protein, partial [Streptomyces sp. SID8455]|nr:enoyl-CoA hydratase/isomerase family protein [Streptomyces sp. SID8455]